MHVSHGSIRLFSALLTGLLCAAGCDDDTITTRYAAFTPTASERAPDSVAGMEIALESSRAAVLELADGELVDLELGAPAGDDLLGGCAGAFSDGDRTLLPVLGRPLVVGDRTFEEPVLEASCDPGTASNRLVLRDESDASCADGSCISFATPEAIELLDTSETALDDAASLPLSNGASDVAASHCLPRGTVECVSCGGGRYRPRTITNDLSNLNPNTPCIYSYSYGVCSYNCAS